MNYYKLNVFTNMDIICDITDMTNVKIVLANDN